MLLHPHVHCLVTAGGLDRNDQWQDTSPTLLFPLFVMGELFRGKFLDELRRLHGDDKLADCELTEPVAFDALCRTLYAKKWVTYAKPSMNGAKHVLQYLGRYTHRVAISNSRIVSIEGDQICFKTKDGKTKTLTHEQFTRRFLLHVLPKGFQKIRHYGLYASANSKTKWQIANAQLLERATSTEDALLATSSTEDKGPRHCAACGSAYITTYRYLPGETMPLSHSARPPPRASPSPKGGPS
jgi:hypothetical protein